MFFVDPLISLLTAGDAEPHH